MVLPDDPSILRKAREASGRRKSPVRLWIEQNYEELTRQPISWGTLARDLAAAGLRDSKNKKPSVQALKNAFIRVKEERGVRPHPPAPRLQPQHPTTPSQADTPGFSFTPVRKKGTPP